MEYPRQFAAIYADADTIWLQVARAIWDVATIDQVVQRSEGVRRSSYELVFQDGARRAIDLRMPSVVVAHRLIDPTYDEIDSWSDDIVKVLPYVDADDWSTSESVKEWRERVHPIWRAGFKRTT